MGTSVSDFQYNDTTPLYTFYEYNTKGTTYKDAYGGLYNWYCVNNNIVSGDSWNVCSGNDLNTLKEYLINTKWRDEVITTNNIGRYVRSCRQVDHPLDIYFKTTWNIPSSGYSFTYPVASYEDGNYNYSIDWGDNTEVEDYYDDTPPTHIYEKAGNYTIKVSGSLPRFAIANGSMKSLLLGVENWGDVGFKSMAYMFQGVTNNIEIPNTLTGHKDVTSMEGMFFSATTFNGDISNWDVSNITNMKYMFRNSSFNQDIGSWNVSKVTNMDAMFYGTPFNQDIGNWNVSKVTNMSNMFYNASNFNQDIGNWNVGNVTNMTCMFMYSYEFNQDIGNWNVSKVTNMSNMFYNASNFNQDIGNWNVSNVTNMSYMFRYATNFNQNIGNWNVGNVTNMTAMFYKANKFNQDLSFWCVSNIATKPTDFDGLASSWTLPNSRPIWGTCPDKNDFVTKWKIPNSEYTFTFPAAQYEGGVYDYWINWGDGTEIEHITGNTAPTHVYAYSGNCYIRVSGSLPRFAIDNGSMKSLLLGVITWGNVGFKSMANMFRGITNNITIPNELTGHEDVTDMTNMFSSAIIFNRDISGWDVSNVTNMSGMFSFTVDFNQDISGWDVSNVTGMSYMFYEAEDFNQDLYWWCVKKISSKPGGFDDIATSWILPRPQWGTCPSKKDLFITSWSLPTSPPYDNSIAFPVKSYFGGNYDYWIDWGDGTIEYFDDDTQPTHTYSIINDYQITIRGSLPHIRNLSDPRFLGVDNWGDIKLQTMEGMFAENIGSNFYLPKTLTGHQDVTDMSYMFVECYEFNQDIGNWDVSNVTNMDGMFAKCESFNQDLSWWCVTNISTKPLDFDYGCISWILPQPDWGNCPEENVFKTTWNIPTNKFNLTFPIVSRGRYDYYINWGDGSPDEYYNDDTPPEHGYHDLGIYTIRVWGKLTDIVADEYSQGDLLLGVDNWGDVDFRTMKFMFKNTGDIYLPNNLTGHDRVESMEGMFLNSEFNADISNWDVSNITNMDFMFSGATNFNQDLSGWCVENITREPRDFYNGSIWHPSLQPQWGEPC